MLRTLGPAGIALWLAGASAWAQGGEEAWSELQALRERLAREVAELEVIAEAQTELVELVKEGGAAEEDGLDWVLCAASALAGLCAELEETFAGGGAVR